MGSIEAFFFVLGLIIGSFLNVCIYRIPRGISITKPLSFCPACKKSIRFYDNIPIISYILLKGKCRYCGNPISIQYPLVELLTGIFSLVLFYKYGLRLEYAFYLIFVSSLIIISGIDIQYQIIPNLITIPGMLFGLLIAFFLGKGLFNAISGLVLGGGSLLLVSWIYSLVTGKEGMGGGDIKLLGMIGAWLGPRSIFPVVMLASFSGVIISIIVFIAKNKGKETAIPFGPFLSLGATCYLLLQHMLPSLFIIP